MSYWLDLKYKILMKLKSYAKYLILHHENDTMNTLIGNHTLMLKTNMIIECFIIIIISYTKSNVRLAKLVLSNVTESIAQSVAIKQYNGEMEI